MAGKFDCGQCGTRHRAGECPMQGQQRGNRWPWNRPVKRKNEEKPLCFPHRWKWSAYTSMNRQMHERHEYCSKCDTPKPGSRDISRHTFRNAICTKCGQLGDKPNVNY
jgi:hypothetical protein